MIDITWVWEESRGIIFIERSNKMITFELLEYKNGRYVYSFAPDLDPNAKGELRYMMMGIV